MSDRRWLVRDRGGAIVGYVDACPGIIPAAAELLAPLPAFDLSPGDVIVQSVGLDRVVAGSAVCFDTKQKLYALREAFGGREWVRETWPRWTAPLPIPERVDGRPAQYGMPARMPRHCLYPEVHLGFLYDARRWGKVENHASSRYRPIVLRASPPAASDPEAVEALLSSITTP